MYRIDRLTLDEDPGEEQELRVVAAWLYEQLADINIERWADRPFVSQPVDPFPERTLMLVPGLQVRRGMEPLN